MGWFHVTDVEGIAIAVALILVMLFNIERKLNTMADQLDLANGYLHRICALAEDLPAMRR